MSTKIVNSAKCYQWDGKREEPWLPDWAEDLKAEEREFLPAFGGYRSTKLIRISEAEDGTMNFHPDMSGYDLEGIRDTLVVAHGTWIVLTEAGDFTFIPNDEFVANVLPVKSNQLLLVTTEEGITSAVLMKQGSV